MNLAGTAKSLPWRKTSASKRLVGSSSSMTSSASLYLSFFNAVVFFLFSASTQASGGSEETAGAHPEEEDGGGELSVSQWQAVYLPKAVLTFPCVCVCVSRWPLWEGRLDRPQVRSSERSISQNRVSRTPPTDLRLDACTHLAVRLPMVTGESSSNFVTKGVAVKYDRTYYLKT